MKLTKDQALTLKNKYGGACAYCGIPLTDRYQKDHIEPLIRLKRYIRDENNQILRDANRKERVETIIKNPENDHIDNLNPSCHKCNNDKSCMTLEQWREIIPHRIHTINTDPKYASYQKAKRFGLVVECDIEVVFWFEKYNAMTALLEYTQRLLMPKLP